MKIIFVILKSIKKRTLYSFFTIGSLEFIIEKRLKHLIFLSFGFALTGCNKLPSSIPIVGAYFPDWVFCIIGGIFMTLIVRALLLCTPLGRNMGLPALLYLALSIVFSCFIWLFFF